MENKPSNLAAIDKQLSSGPTTVDKEAKISEENVHCIAFVNHAAMAWNERRKQWLGDQSRKPHRVTREPIISWCTAYEDLLSTDQPFPQPIPLADMVDFLVDIWHEEGLFD